MCAPQRNEWTSHAVASERFQRECCLTLGAADEQIGQSEGAGNNSYRSSVVEALERLAADPWALYRGRYGAFESSSSETTGSWNRSHLSGRGAASFGGTR